MYKFPVTIYGDIEKYSETISKARCRIFYKYGNRNGTYITDEFADKLLSTVAYAPVKGIYSGEDYTDHGQERNEGRIYGVVPENPNITWEDFLDEDGVNRTYACVDVLLFTGIYKEANEIVGKSQSMEIYDKSISGDYQIINGIRYFVFTEGSFLGLQVLGDNVEPCFEGASFYSFVSQFQKLLNDLQKVENSSPKGGNSKMKMNFKLSDSQKENALWTLLNTNYTEEGGWLVEFALCDVYDDYALAFKYEDGSYWRVYYTKDDATDSLAIEKKERCYIVDVSESEKSALDALRAFNGGTYEKIDEKVANASENETKIGELNELVSTLTTERDEAQTSLATATQELANAQSAYAALEQEKNTLAAFKQTTELTEKQRVLNTYAPKLGAETVEKYREKLGEYSIENLQKDLAFELVQANPAIFSANPQTDGFVPKDTPKTGIEAILERYVNK